jgi:hypothetical protein
MAPRPDDDFVVDFPTLGFLVADWTSQHCVVPDGFQRGEPFVPYPWQLWATVNHYRVKADAKWVPAKPVLAPSFFYRRSQVIAPQKTGKGPWSATIVLAEAVGPVVFAGWAAAGDVYRCSDHGCSCGWVYAYEVGEPKGMPWPTPLIQLLATSEDQVDNVYRPLQMMVKGGPLSEMLAVSEEFTRLPGGGRIDVVTSNAQSRLGNPITFALQDETGLYTKQNKMIRVAETQRRGASGMGGRVMETTNAYDPSEDSVAQRTAEGKAADVYRFHRLPPAVLNYKVKEERRRIHRWVYAGSEHVNLDAIEAEAAEIMEHDPAQAERFYGNRIVAGTDAYLEPATQWDVLAAPVQVQPGARICFGFDGSQYDDWTAIRCRVIDRDRMYGFTPHFADGKAMRWAPADHGGEVPRGEVGAALEYLFDTYDVVRGYFDPELWQSEIDAWAAVYGDKRILEWPTNRPRQMAAALERWHTDVTSGSFDHDGDPVTAAHVRNARRVRRGMYVLVGKPTEHQKIDDMVADALAHEAANDAIAAGLQRARRYRSMSA